MPSGFRARILLIVRPALRRLPNSVHSFGGLHMVTALIEPIERLVARHTDASSLAAWLAEDTPSVDCREEACKEGGVKGERDFLADVGDAIFMRRGTRNPD